MGTVGEVGQPHNPIVTAEWRRTGITRVGNRNRTTVDFDLDHFGEAYQMGCESYGLECGEQLANGQLSYMPVIRMHLCVALDQFVDRHCVAFVAFVFRIPTNTDAVVAESTVLLAVHDGDDGVELHSPPAPGSKLNGGCFRGRDGSQRSRR